MSGTSSYWIRGCEFVSSCSSSWAAGQCDVDEEYWDHQIQANTLWQFSSMVIELTRDITLASAGLRLLASEKVNHTSYLAHFLSDLAWLL